MSFDQGWITEEACFTVPPGPRQVRQRKEVKMSQLCRETYFPEEHGYRVANSAQESSRQGGISGRCGPGLMTVLQSVCSHGHKFQFADVQQAFNTGDRIKREQPLFVRMPPDGVPGEPRDVWVQLLKTVNGQADGTREWRKCFLATARGLGFETSVAEPCVEVLRSPHQGYHGIIGVAVEDIARGRDEVWEQDITKILQSRTHASS